MTIQTVIKKAIEGGYTAYSKNVSLNQITSEEAMNAKRREYPDEKIFLDPQFWTYLFGDKEFGKMSAKRFIDDLFEGKTPEQFFQDLI